MTGLGRVGRRACGEGVQEGRGSAHVGAVEVVGGRQDDHGATSMMIGASQQRQRRCWRS